MHKHLNQRGVSLISMMVALSIGVFLLAGIFQIWFLTRQTFSAQGQLASLQDNERMALTTMANTVQTAGYYPVHLNYPTPPSPAYSAQLFVASGSLALQQYIYGTHDGTLAGESLTIRYIADQSSADSTTLDCQGQIESTGTLVTNTYKVIANLLQCSTDGGKTYRPIIQGTVSNMSFYYGVDTLGTGTALQYLTADQVSKNSLWSRVFSVYIQLTFNNPLHGLPGEMEQQPATLPTISRVVAITHS